MDSTKKREQSVLKPAQDIFKKHLYDLKQRLLQESRESQRSAKIVEKSKKELSETIAHHTSTYQCLVEELTLKEQDEECLMKKQEKIQNIIHMLQSQLKNEELLTVKKQNRISKLEQELRTSTAELQDARATCEEERKDLSIIKRAVYVAHDKAKQNEDKMGDANDHVCRIADQCNKLRAQIDFHAALIMQHAQSTQKIKEQLSVVDSAQEKARKEIISAERKWGDVLKRLRLRDHALHTAREHRASLEDRWNACSNEVQAIDHQVDATWQRNVQLCHDIETMSKQKHAKQAALADAEQRLHKEQRKLEQLQEKRAQSQLQLETAQKEAEKTEKDAEKIAMDVATLDAQCHDVQTVLLQYCNAQETNETAMKALIKHLHAAQEQRQSLDSLLSATQDKIAARHLMIDATQRKIHDVNEQLSEITASATQKHHLLETAIKEESDLLKDIDRHSRALHLLKEKSGLPLTRDISPLQNEITNIQKEIAGIDGQVDFLQTEWSSLQCKFFVVHQKLSSFTQKELKSSVSLKEFSKRHLELMSKQQSIESDIVVLRKKLHQIRNKTERQDAFKEETAVKQNQDISSLQTQLDASQQQLQNLQQQIIFATKKLQTILQSSSAYQSIISESREKVSKMQQEVGQQKQQESLAMRASKQCESRAAELKKKVQSMQKLLESLYTKRNKLSTQLIRSVNAHGMKMQSMWSIPAIQPNTSSD